MPKVKALNRNGEITWCTAKVPGHGNCNHVFHKTKDVSDEQFQQEVDNYNEKMTRLVHSGNVKWRLEAALAGYGLERLVYDKNPEVRAAVASQGYGLDKLINDPSPLVRRAVAKQDYGLEILKDDLSSIVRNCAIKRLEEAKHVFTTDDIADAFIKDPDIKADILRGLNADGGKLYWAKFSTGAFGKRATKILKEPLEWANIKLKDGQATVILQKIICTLEKEGYKWREGPNDTTEFAKD